MTTVAVIVLVIDAIWNSVSASTGRGCSRFVTPYAAMSSSPSWRMPIATPGTWYRDIPSRTSFSSSGRTRELCALLVRRHPADPEAAVTERDLLDEERDRPRDVRGGRVDDSFHRIDEPRRKRVGRQVRDLERELVPDRAAHHVGARGYRDELGRGLRGP